MAQRGGDDNTIRMTKYCLMESFSSLSFGITQFVPLAASRALLKMCCFSYEYSCAALGSAGNADGTLSE